MRICKVGDVYFDSSLLKSFREVRRGDTVEYTILVFTDGTVSRIKGAIADDVIYALKNPVVES